MKEQLKSAIAFAVSMPHAALWVVQLYRLEEIIESLEVSMPHAALWVVQQSRKKSTDSWKSCFNAARGFVGGAAHSKVQESKEGKPFPCRTRLCGWCSFSCFKKRTSACGFQCRTRLCGWCSKAVYLNISATALFQCRTRLCGWCSKKRRLLYVLILGFNAARGFVGGAASLA